MSKDCNGTASGDGCDDPMLKVLRQQLNESGRLSKIKCELRDVILKKIREGDKSPLSDSGPRSASSPTQAATHLVMEYLDYMGFQYTKEMLATESGCGSAPSFDFSETKIGNEAGVKELPLLLSMTIKLMSDKEMKKGK